MNTDKVHQGQQPASIEALRIPCGRAGSAWRSPTRLVCRLTKYFLDKGRTQAEVDKLFAALASNAKVVNGHTTQVQLLARDSTTSRHRPTRITWRLLPTTARRLPGSRSPGHLCSRWCCAPTEPGLGERGPSGGRGAVHGFPALAIRLNRSSPTVINWDQSVLTDQHPSPAWRPSASTSPRTSIRPGMNDCHTRLVEAASK
jgi:hypothetical protein